MKKALHVIFVFLCISNVIAQHTFSNTGTGGGAQVGIGTNAPAFNARLHVEAQSVGTDNGERLFYGTVPDAPNQYIAITNGASRDSIFNPLIMGTKSGANNGTALMLMSNLAPANDTAGFAPAMVFNVRRGYLPNASGASTAVQNRPAFQWSNLNTPLMTMLPNGNLGIGTAAPSAILHTTGNLRFQNLPANNYQDVLVVDNNGNVARSAYTPLTMNCNNSNYVPIVSGGNSLGCSQIFDNGTFVGIGTTTAPQNIKLNVNGNIQAVGITTLSDEKYKGNATDIRGALAIVLNLKPIMFEWIDSDEISFDKRKHFGLVAQELEREVPEVVLTNEDGIKSVNYIELIPVLINAIQEQQKEIDELKALLEKGK